MAKDGEYRMPKLYFITYRISKAFTGGELCSRLLLKGAQAAGYKIGNWEGIKYHSLVKHSFLMNLIYLYRTLSIFPDSFLLLDMDFHARYVLALLWARHIKKIPIIGLLYHYNYWDKTNFFSRKIHLMMETFVSKRCDYLITISKFSAGNFRTLSHRDIPMFILTPFSRDAREHPTRVAQFDPAKPRLLLIGSVERRKNIINTIKAFAMLEENYSFDIVGFWPSANYLQEVRATIRSLGLERRVILHGKIESEQLREKYSSATAFILVSRMEGYGMVFAEAMAFGLPIVATTRGAVPEVVEEGTNGLLCDPDNVGQIAEAIRKIHKKEIWQTISDNNLSKAQMFKTGSQFEIESRELFGKILVCAAPPAAANILP